MTRREARRAAFGGTDAAKEIYEDRAATAETVHADAKAHRGLSRVTVRGRDEVLSCAVLFALTSDLRRLVALGA